MRAEGEPVLAERLEGANKQFGTRILVSGDTAERCGEAIRFPIARTTTSKRNWSETYEWDLAPDLDTYYALVATDAQVARKLANHIDRLPMRCTEAIRPGLADEALQEWFEELAMLTARASDEVDWRAIKVREVL